MALQSFIEYKSDSDFPIQNLPYGVFKTQNRSARIGVAIGEYILDLYTVAEHNLFSSNLIINSFKKSTLNEFMSLGRSAWTEARNTIQNLLLKDNPQISGNNVRNIFFVHQSEAQMLLPADIGDYSDFYASKEHATNVGTMFRGKENALNPNWVWMPIGYHSRASSVVVSGTPVRRPKGQIKTGNDNPILGACQELDYELEMGVFVGPGNNLSEPIKIENAANHIFGYVILNDWSARDIQRWEYVPLGPFGAKNFATTISPWIVTVDALESFKCTGPIQDPAPLPYLKESGANSYDINLFTYILTNNMKEPFLLTNTNLKYMYWSTKQQLVHHTITGCNMKPGDLLGTGTISGATPESRACFLELSWKGTTPVKLPNGETRSNINDGDEIIMSGYSQGNGYRIGFGTCTGVILPAYKE